MGRIPDATIDLIATDPPFNSAKFRASKKTKYPDFWKLGKQFTDRLESRLGDSQAPQGQKDRLFTLLDLLGDKDKPNSDRTFIAFMALRAIEMYRILKEDGSLYWQCNSTMSHALKLMLDIVFGKKNFRNEIVWHHPKIGVATKKWTSNTDAILFYVKSTNAKFTAQVLDTPNELAERWQNKLKENRLLYAQAKTIKDSPAQSKIKVLTKELGRPLEDSDVVVDFNDVKNKKVIDNVWLIPFLKGNSSESIGYPTQKPLELFERIIKASSSPGDLILDPFCGCATTPIATLIVGEGRQFIGIDVNGTAIKAIRDRLSKEARKGSLAEGFHSNIQYIVNKELVADSIADINNLLITAQVKLDKLLTNKPELTTGTSSKEMKVLKKIEDYKEDIEKLQADRTFLQSRLTEAYPTLEDYLDPIETSYLYNEPELTPQEKLEWKKEQIQLRRIEGSLYDCPGFFSKGRSIKCLTLTEDGVYPVGNTKSIEIDRVIPGSMGGKYTQSNIQAICNKCNAAKSNKV